MEYEEEGTDLLADCLLYTSPQGHKFALRPIQAGEEVVKYGFRIGFAKEDIPTGSWVHVHNVKTGLGDVLSYTYEPAKMDVEPTEHAYFQGYRRADGKVGVRNEIWIIPTAVSYTHLDVYKRQLQHRPQVPRCIRTGCPWDRLYPPFSHSIRSPLPSPRAR